MRREKFWRWLAHQMPRALVYFCTIRLFAHATTGKWGACHPVDVNIFQALDRWSEPNP